MLLLLPAPVADRAQAGAISIKQTLRFAAEMASKGNWREAKYRWELVRQQRPGEALVLNNLAVACEAAGELEQAREYYDRALAASKSDPHIVDNHRRFTRFARENAGEQEKQSGSEARRAAVAPKKRSKIKSKVIRVDVELPVPPKLDLEGLQTLLVASFLTEENLLLDTNRQLVRFLRGEFRKRTQLEVLDVVPPPSVPEQNLEDLIQNREFWKYLSREYGADLIVSGVVSYDRQDYSGWQEVDVVSQYTGQKVRQTRFVEQERFTYALDVFFIDGASGTLLYRDRMNQAMMFRGQMNDPITAFFALSEAIAFDVLAVVAPRTRQDSRFVFRG